MQRRGALPLFALSALVALSAFGCAGRAASGAPQASGPADNGYELPGTGETVTLPKGVWFQKEGGLLVVGKAGRVRFELSAPITPCAPALQGPYPSTPAEREQLASRASLPFVYFIGECIPNPATEVSPQEPSDEQLRQNYLDVAKCAKRRLRTQPAWLPALVADVDICMRALGPNFSLPRREELDAITSDERTAMAQALFATEAGIGYESLTVYAREKDGSIGTVSLGQSQAPVALRCLRTKPGQATPPSPVPEAASCVKSLLQAAQAPEASPPPAPLAPLHPAIARFVEFAKNRTGDFDRRIVQREIDAVKATASALSVRFAETTRARREASERYQQAVQAVEEEGVSEAEHERRVQEFKALRKKVESAESAPALSASDARDFAELESAVQSIDILIIMELAQLSKELDCIARKCDAKVRPRSIVENRIQALERLREALKALVSAGNPAKK